ncbi:hypothetical protein SORBI_3005G023100 [Sorghum bicolor]|uniref:Uncharacterized protein n=2 Tax=Sorghum bicolor TaxID=4558 RepID=A0A1Z5RHG7_SORBI|nr:hypothetical protein SORBI_3005G023100 [Sorghum bicolor]
MYMDDQGLLSELHLAVDLRPSQTARGTSTLGRDEKRRRLTGPSPASPMDLDDPLSEILLRLPPLPSSLPRASLVCTRWRRLVTDPSFLRRFRAHHWKPLGVFFGGDRDLSFSFFLGPRDSAPSERFSLRVPRECHEGGGGGQAGRNDCFWEFFGCRHGRVVLANRSGYGYGTRQILVWNPVTGEDHLLGVSQFSDSNQSPYGLHMQAAVICASGHNGPFKLALAWEDRSRAHVCVYSSETGAWGNIASTAILRPWFIVGRGNVMVGNTIYWILFGGRVRILEFDLDRQKLSVIKVPQAANDYENHCGVFLCTLAKGGGLSLMVMSENLRGQLWVWEKTADGVFQWMLQGTIELDMLLSLRSEGHRSILWLEGDDNVMFVSTYKGIFMVHLQSMQFEKIFETDAVSDGSIFPFKYLHAPGDILHQGGVGSGVQGSGQGHGEDGGVQGSGQGHGEDRADRPVPHVSIKDGGVAGLKRADAHVSWEGGGPMW